MAHATRARELEGLVKKLTTIKEDKVSSPVPAQISSNSRSSFRTAGPRTAPRQGRFADGEGCSCRVPHSR